MNALRITGLCAILLCSGVAHAEAPWGTPGALVTSGSSAVDAVARVRFDAQLDVDEPVVDAGTPVVLRYEVKNTGAAPLVLWHAGFWTNHTVVVLDDSGNEPAPTAKGTAVRAAFSPQGPRDKNVEWPVAPGAIDDTEGRVDLGTLYHLTTPGKYTVTITYEEEFRMVTNALTFWVVPVGAAAELERLNQWDTDDTDVAERPQAYPGRKAAGETHGWLSSGKEALADLGVDVVWDATALRYRVASVK